MSTKDRQVALYATGTDALLAAIDATPDDFADADIDAAFDRIAIWALTAASQLNEILAGVK